MVHRALSFRDKRRPPQTEKTSSILKVEATLYLAFELPRPSISSLFVVPVVSRCICFLISEHISQHSPACHFPRCSHSIFWVSPPIKPLIRKEEISREEISERGNTRNRKLDHSTFNSKRTRVVARLLRLVNLVVSCHESVLLWRYVLL